MSKQDRQGVRNAADVERKYNIGGFIDRQQRENARQDEELNLQSLSSREFMAYAIRTFESLNQNIQTINKALNQLSDNDIALNKKATELGVQLAGIEDELENTVQNAEAEFAELNRKADSLDGSVTALSSPSVFYEYDWSECMVRITRYGKIRFANIYIDTKVAAASTLGTLLEIDRPAYNVRGAEWIPKSDNSAFGSRTVEINTNGQVSTDADAWRGGFSIMYVVP